MDQINSSIMYMRKGTNNQVGVLQRFTGKIFKKYQTTLKPSNSFLSFGTDIVILHILSPYTPIANL